MILAFVALLFLAFGVAECFLGYTMEVAFSP